MILDNLLEKQPFVVGRCFLFPREISHTSSTIFSTRFLNKMKTNQWLIQHLTCFRYWFLVFSSALFQLSSSSSLHSCVCVFVRVRCVTAVRHTTMLHTFTHRKYTRNVVPKTKTATCSGGCAGEMLLAVCLRKRAQQRYRRTTASLCDPSPKALRACYVGVFVCVCKILTDLSSQHASTTGGLDALLGQAGEEFRLHDDRAASLRESAGSEQLEVTLQWKRWHYRLVFRSYDGAIKNCFSLRGIS